MIDRLGWTPPPWQKRGCTDKAWFDSKKQAKRTARLHADVALKPYKCRYCAGWHLATRRD